MASPSPLLSLPGELREVIYGYYFTHDSTLPTPHASRSPLALASTCRQLHRETHARAFLATTFKSHCWLLRELKIKFAQAPMSLRPYIKRLEITVHVSELIRHPSSLQGLRLADAGLTGLKELYIQYTGKPKSESGETYIVSNLENVLWKTVVSRKNIHLKKIRVVHRGALRYISVKQLYDRMGSWLPLPWATEQNWSIEKEVNHNRFHLIRKGEDSKELRRVSILLGYTVREAEDFQAVRNEVLEHGKILENVQVRRSDIKDVADLDNETLAYEIEQLCRDLHLTDQIDTSAYY
ncbi:hypothetical protein CC80DRAFT_495410 [Byssothecium circinans]|uniref:Uncharacterized protein n=1 Tax=Byssothecium circinans TaxID=147558 RepID=A0A6A5TJJ7_9PLEO|nr:hypothetical protein CC80DRAFT_495410 [Byssothecium circinans]